MVVKKQTQSFKKLTNLKDIKVNKLLKTTAVIALSVTVGLSIAGCSSPTATPSPTVEPTATVSPAEIKTEFQEYLQQSIVETNKNGVLEETETSLKAYNPYYINYDPNAALSGVFDKNTNIYNVPTNPLVTNIQILEYILGDETINNDTGQPVNIKIEKTSDSLYIVNIPKFNADLIQQPETQTWEVTIVNKLIEKMVNSTTGETVQVRYGDLKINEIIAKANQNRL